MIPADDSMGEGRASTIVPAVGLEQKKKRRATTVKLVEPLTQRCGALTVQHNIAGSGGGVGIQGSGLTISIERSLFSYNSARGGGGLYTSRATRVFQSDFGLNSVTAAIGALSGGGAIKADGVGIEVRECNIGHNTVDATAASAPGGRVIRGCSNLGARPKGRNAQPPTS